MNLQMMNLEQFRIQFRMKDLNYNRFQNLKKSILTFIKKILIHKLLISLRNKMNFLNLFKNYQINSYIKILVFMKISKKWKKIKNK